MLRAEEIHLAYGATVALASASATVADGEIVAVTGPSGCGKSSLLYCLAGLVRPDRGSVVFDGQTLSGLSDEGRSDVRRRWFGFVFQFAELVPELTLRENIALPLELNGTARRAVTRRVDDLLERLDLGPQADRRPSRVSGGQAQRAAVARAIIHEPRVVFADEPTGALDSDNAMVVLGALRDLTREQSTAVVLVTHDQTMSAIADRMVAMKDGRMVAAGAAT